MCPNNGQAYMNPIFSLLIKQLPRLLPIVRSMLERPPSKTRKKGDWRASNNP